MAVIDFTVTKYATGRGSGAASIRSSRTRISGQDTITTAENLEDASGDITLAAGDILAIHSDVAIRIAFGGTAATGTTGHYIPAAAMIEIEVHGDDAGTVSAIEAS
jgi:hypothetical protein